MQTKSLEQLRQLTYLLIKTDSLYHKVNVRMDIADSEGWILYFLYNNGGSCTQNKIAILYGISRKTINSALEKLESKGILTRTPEKGKNITVSLTEEGIRFAEKTVVPLIKAENSVFEKWEDKDTENLLRLQEKFYSDFEKVLTSMNLIDSVK